LERTSKIAGERFNRSGKADSRDSEDTRKTVRFPPVKRIWLKSEGIPNMRLKKTQTMFMG